MRTKTKFTTIIALLLAALLVVDSQTALRGAQIGISISLKTIIPSLLPLFTLSSLIIGNSAGKGARLLRPLGMICGLSSGTEHIFLLGLAGGYPTGAMSVWEARKQKKISTDQAKHMLLFCNNAGPALIFGICGPAFANPLCAWYLWLIQIFSAVLVGCLFKRKQQNSSCSSNSSEFNTTFSQAMDKGIMSTLRVCGWVIIFRALMEIGQARCESAVSDELKALLLGTLELTNGCIELDSVVIPGLRFICASYMLTFGGLCVVMQTASVIGDMNPGIYILGKAVQAIFSIFLSSVVQFFAFSPFDRAPHTNFIILISAVILAIIAIITFCFKKRVDFQNNVVYNQRNVPMKGVNYALSQENG